MSAIRCHTGEPTPANPAQRDALLLRVIVH